MMLIFLIGFNEDPDQKMIAVGAERLKIMIILRGSFIFAITLAMG